MKRERVIIYGAGGNCKLFLKYADSSSFQVVGYADQNWCGKPYEKMVIMEPDQITNCDYDKVLVTPSEYHQIVSCLIERCGINKEDIETVKDINSNYILHRISNAKYVLFIDQEDYLEYLYKELDKMDSFLMIDTLWMKERWTDSVDIDEEERIIIFGIYDYVRYKDNGFFAYIKKKYVNAKTVMIVYDICDGDKGFETIIPGFSVEQLKKEFDLVITYHSGEAKRHGMCYRPYPYPSTPIKYRKKNSADLVFVGAAKDRLLCLHDIYHRATEAGLLCRFWIVGVSEEEQIEGEGLIYNQRLSYRDYLQEVMNAKCILEICQNGDETSFRYQEAVVHHRKLLVNDPHVQELKYYDTLNMQYFSNPEDIDFLWCKEPIAEYEYEMDFEPKEFICFLNKYFEV